MKRIWATYKKSFAGLPNPVWWLSLVAFVNKSGTMVLTFLTLYLTTSQGLSISQAGLILSVYGVGAIFGGYLSGFLIDKSNSRTVQIWALWISGVLFILLGYVSGYSQIIGAIFIVSLASEAVRPANAVAIAEASTEALHSRSFALNRLAVNVGATIGPAIGGWLASFNYGLIFWVEGITCILAGFVLVLSPKWKIPQTIIKENHPLPYTDKHFLMFLFLTFILALSFFQIFSTYPLYLKYYFGLGEKIIGLVFALNAVIIILTEMPLIHMLESKNILKIIAIGAMLMCLGLAILPFNNSPIFLSFTVVVWTIGEMLSLPFMTSYVAKIANAQHRGKYMAMYTMAFSAAFLAAPLSGTWIYENMGADMVWYSLYGTGAICFVGFYWILPKIKTQ